MLLVSEQRRHREHRHQHTMLTQNIKNISKMKSDFEEISRRSVDYDKVYFIPGIGEGLAKLKEKAPKTYAWMKKNMPMTTQWLPATNRMAGLLKIGGQSKSTTKAT